LGTRAVDVQTVMPRMVSRSRNGENVEVLCGTEYLTAVTASGGSGNVAGDLLSVLAINPSAFTKTRIAQFAPLYQRYRFSKLRFIYEPIANATQSGQIIGFGDYDYDNQLATNSPDNVRQAAAHINEAISQIWEPRAFDFGILDDFTTLFTNLNGGENRLIYQGVFYLIAASTLGPDLPLGNIYIEYECEFSIQQLQVNSVPDNVLSLVANTRSATFTALLTDLVPNSLNPNFTNNIPFLVDGDGFVTMNLPAGNYFFFFQGFAAIFNYPVGGSVSVVAAADFTGSDSEITVIGLSVGDSGNPDFSTTTGVGNTEVSSGSSYFLEVAAPLGQTRFVKVGYSWDITVSGAGSTTPPQVVSLIISSNTLTDTVPTIMRRSDRALTVAKPKWEVAMEREMAVLRRSFMDLLKEKTFDEPPKAKLLGSYPTLHPRVGSIASEQKYRDCKLVSPAKKKRVKQIIEVTDSSDEEKV